MTTVNIPKKMWYFHLHLWSKLSRFGSLSRISQFNSDFLYKECVIITPVKFSSVFFNDVWTEMVTRLIKSLFLDYHTHMGKKQFIPMLLWGWFRDDEDLKARCHKNISIYKDYDIVVIINSAWHVFDIYAYTNNPYNSANSSNKLILQQYS